MMSKAYFSKITAILKRQSWLIFLWFVSLFFALPVPAALVLQQARSRYLLNADRLLSATELHAQVMSISRESMLQIFGRQSFSLTWVLLILSFLSALVFAGYMQRQRQVDFYHSQPISRRDLLLQHMIAGLLAVLLPYLANLLLTLIVAIFMGAATAIPWGELFAAIALHSIYLLSIFLTVLLAMIITGNGAVAMKVGLIFLAVGPSLLGLGLVLANGMFYPTFYSALYNWDLIVRWLSPAAAYICLPINGLPHGILPILIYDGLLLALCLHLYQKRPSEGAGKAVVFNLAKPLLKYTVAILFATLLAYIFHSIGNYSDNWFWWYFGAVCGGFLATQIIEIVYAYDFRAIRRNLRGLLIFLIIYLGLATCAMHDVGGFNSKVPAANQVASAQIYLTGINNYVYERGGYYYGSNYNGNIEAELALLQMEEQDYLDMGPVTSPEAIAAAVKLAHGFADRYQSGSTTFSYVGEAERAALTAAGKEYVLDYLDGTSNNYISLNTFSCRVVFTLENGRKLARDYATSNNIPIQLMLAEIAAIYDEEDFAAAQLKRISLPDEYYLPEHLKIFELYYGAAPLPPLSMDQRSQLLAALRADALDLTVAEQSQEMPLGLLVLRCYGGPADYSELSDTSLQRPNRWQNWPIYASSQRTLAFLDQLGYGPELWQPQLDDIQRITVMDYNNEKRVEAEKYAGAMMPPEIRIDFGSYKSVISSQLIDMESNEITDKAEIALLMENSYPADAPEYNKFMDIQQGLELEVWYMGQDGQTYTLRRVLPY